MIDVGYVRTMARYNRWQNESLYGAADRLADTDRKLDRGAFFGSIHATLNHLLWADRTWMSRLAGMPKPEVDGLRSVSLHEAWDDLGRERALFDATMIDWADRLDPPWIEGDLTWYSGAAKRELTKPKPLLLVHLFNHQTHHRGQVHAMLTQAGVKPDDTDLMLMRLDPSAPSAS